AVPVVFAIGVASILYSTSTTAIVQVESRPEMHGRVLALQSVLLVGTTPIGGLLVGWLADTVGARAPLVLGGVVCLAAAAFGFVAARRHAGELYDLASTHGELPTDVLETTAA
ncbi:MAG TPA: hypothetical protein VFX21_00060, partial [Acidimicrobiia bacterium]|nr:hypothetical protein [Acidimicrobiia bacterium]